MLLSGYLATEMLAPFFASFLIINSVFFLVRLIPFLNVVLDLGIGGTDFIRLFSYLFPNMFLYSMPMAVMLGVIIAFTRLSADNEILALKAGGISLYHTMPALIIVTLGISLLTAYCSVTLIPAGETAMKQLMLQLVREKISKGIQERQFTDSLGDIVIHVEHIEKQSGEWQKVWVSDKRNQDQPTITMADTGRMEIHDATMQISLILHNGSLHRPAESKSQIIAFERYQVNIPVQIPTIIDGDDLTKLSARAMTMDQLQESAHQLGRDTHGGRNRLIHYHKRLALPAGCFILGLLGLPLGLQSGPGRRAGGIPLGLTAFVSYYILFTLVKNIAESSSMPIWMLLWTPNIILLGATLYCIRQVTNEKVLIPDVVMQMSTVLNNKCFLPLMRLSSKLIPRQKIEKTIPPATSCEISILLDDTIHGDIHNRIYHLPGCTFYDCNQCTLEFKTIELAQAAGLSPCKLCRKSSPTSPSTQTT